MIYSDRSGILECRIPNTGSLVWRISDINNVVTPLLIPGKYSVDDPRIVRLGYAAYLAEKNPPGGNISNRTSILLVLPSTSNKTISVTCTGGNERTTCSGDINFICNVIYMNGHGESILL